MSAIPKNAVIYVAGHHGMVGGAIFKELQTKGYTNIVTAIHAELELTNQDAVEQFFEKYRPEYIFLAAAKVGGIYANNTYRAEFIYQNIMIQSNVIDAAYRYGVKRLLFLGSSCIYPRECPQPMKEEYLLTGPLEPTNQPYAVAKISGIETCWSYNRQYNTRFLAVMPTNLYGVGDNYHPENSHVLPALIRRAHECKMKAASSMTVWGTGKVRREFLFAGDMANAAVMLLSLEESCFETLFNEQSPPLINIGSGKDITIAEVAQIVAETVCFKGELVFDTTKPDGTERKLLDISLLKSMEWSPQVSLNEGLKLAYEDFLRKIK